MRENQISCSFLFLFNGSFVLTWLFVCSLFTPSLDGCFSTTTTTTTTTYPPTSETKTTCNVQFRRQACYTGSCNRDLGVYCCCGSNTAAVLLPDQSSTCHQYYGTNECDALRVTCTSCASDGFCECTAQKAPS